MVTMTLVVSPRWNGVGYACRYLDRRRAGMLSGSAYFCLFAIRGVMRCIIWAGLPAKRLQRLSVVTKPAAGILIRGRALSRRLVRSGTKSRRVV